MNLTRIAVIAGLALIVLLMLIVWDIRKGKTLPGKPKGRRKVSPSLQGFLPIERFHESGAMVVGGKFRRLIRVGDLNLYSMSLEEITSVRDRFREMLKRLNHPFQLSVQARRANYTDFVQHSSRVIDDTVQKYQNPTFEAYTTKLKRYLRVEAQKPRTDRENLIVIGVLPKMGGEEETTQLERLERELGYVETGLAGMALPYQVLDPIGSIEAVQNFWNRERAVSQRYRDGFARGAHSPMIIGADVEVNDIVQGKAAETKNVP